MPQNQIYKSKQVLKRTFEEECFPELGARGLVWTHWHMPALMHDNETWSFDVQTHIQRTRPSAGWLFWLLFWIHQWWGDPGRAEHHLTDTLSRTPNPTWVLCTVTHLPLRHSHCRAGEPCSYPSTSSMLGTAGALGAARLSHCGTEGHRRHEWDRRSGEDWVCSFGNRSQPHLLTREEKGRPIFSKKSR